ncbi:ABC transporter ATP-binding protein, partial [Enterococcus sp. RTP21361st1_A6_RTP21361_211029]|uniref:ABC transporter ATP-binding protein n=1 Tax=Enterococcus sp. RTP21361st1_A6_RTP21361_211029 TaxID=3143199 RepID=UPI0034A403F5
MTTVAVSSLPQGTSVTLRNVTKSFGTTKVLNGLDLNIHSGELVALLGPSGCGKSTLLRIIAGFEAADQGSVLLDDVDVSGVPTNRRDIGLVFQAYSLFPVMYGLSIRHVAKTEAKSSAVELLASVGLADYADRYPAQLSGGQQQRVALARALATKPRVLLLDEPLSALDAKVRVQLRDEIRALQLETHTTTIMVTHDQEEAL